MRFKKSGLKKLGAGTLCLLLLTIASPESKCAAETPQELNSQAIQAMRQGSFDESEKLFKQAMETCAATSDGYASVVSSNLAVLYRKMGKESDAQALENGSAQGQQPEQKAQAGSGDLKFQVTDKEYAAYARTQVNRIVSMKLKAARNVFVDSTQTMKKPDGTVLVRVQGRTGDKMVAVDVVVHKTAAGQLSVASSRCETYYPGHTPESMSSSIAGMSSGGGSILSGSGGGGGGGAFSGGGMGGMGGSGGGGCVYAGGGGCYSGGF